jgi:predicted small secreted protein
MKKILFLLLLQIPLLTFAQECITEIEVIDIISSDELTLMQQIESIHEDLSLSQSVTRLYKIIGSDSTLIKTVLNYSKDNDGFVNGGYVYYSVSIHPDNQKIDYYYSAGSAYSAHGEVTILNNNIIRTEYSYGTQAGITSIWVNGKKVYEELEDIIKD